VTRQARGRVVRVAALVAVRVVHLGLEMAAEAGEGRVARRRLVAVRAAAPLTGVGSGEDGERVLEARALPAEWVVAGHAVGREARSAVLAIVVVDVAGDTVVGARSRNEHVATRAVVTGRALDRRVAAHELEPTGHDEVVEGDVPECDRRMAVGARRREAESLVVDEGRGEVVAHVTGAALRVERPECTPHVVLVTALAGGLQVRALERETGRVRHTDRDIGERRRRVARRACAGDGTLMDVVVTGRAVGGRGVRSLEVEAGVAARAGRLRVTAVERKPGLPVIEGEIRAQR